MGSSNVSKSPNRSFMSKNMNTFADNYKHYVEDRMINPEKEELLIAEMIDAQTELERAIISDASFRKGLFWGTPRYGHPEGKVIFHIKEVMENVNRIPDLDSDTKNKLRLITLIHDSFKYKEDASRKIHGRMPDNHHAVYAAQFAAPYITDTRLVRLIELHDEAYYSWQLFRQHRFVECQLKLDRLKRELGDYFQLFYLFFKCDTKTGDKNQAPLHWFESTVKEIEVVDF